MLVKTPAFSHEMSDKVVGPIDFPYVNVIKFRSH